MHNRLPAACLKHIFIMSRSLVSATIGSVSLQVAVAGNTLWLLGGVVEVGESEITLDDMWSLDLVKLDGWQLVKENTVGEEVFKAAAAKAGAAGSDDSEWEDASTDEEA